VSEAEPTHRDEGHAVSAITWGIAIVLAGVALILWTTGALRLGNWWAVFIFIPAIGTFVEAIQRYRRAGNRFTRSAASALTGSLFLAAVAVMFLFALDWSKYWGVFIVLAGVSVILSAIGRKPRADRPAP
jgi:O-antigen/teichoic acid export membrane protein